MQYHRQSGFTLVELMVVIAIIGILAGIAVPAYNNHLVKSRMTEAERNIAALKLAEEEYFLENNSYFSGDNNAELNTASDNLWEVQGTDEGEVNFDYAVNVSSGSYTITATGKSGTLVAGKTLTDSN